MRLNTFSYVVAAADGLSLEEFDRLEREAEEFEGLAEQDPHLFEGDIIRSFSRYKKLYNLCIIM